MKSVLFLMIGSLALFGCTSHDRGGIDPITERKASSAITDSFAVAALGEAKNPKSGDRSDTSSEYSGPDLGVEPDRPRVRISRLALGREFLLTTNMSTQIPTPMFSALQSRVVAFVLRDQKVFLVDVTKNNQVGLGRNIPQNILLAEFPVLADSRSFLTIDFNAGMKQIFTVGDMAASDDSEAASAPLLPAAQVRMSYLEEVKFEGNALFIRQVAQIEAPAEHGKQAIPTEVRYQLKPYLPDAGFIPVKSPGLNKVGYFEANPLMLPDGSQRIYAMKWNEKKTIRFAISANTPVKYRELIKGGLLYWNKILGERAIEVVQLEDASITAPRFDMNILQWADWDAAGYAFADAQVDPRSGEVTSAQIFLPSAFFSGNGARRVRLVESARPVVGLKGFRSARLCQRDLNEDLANADSTPISAEAMEKALFDYVYEVVAHELGHVLGLRHNFAGNLAANYDFKDRKELIMKYYREMKAPQGVVSSNSVMEYSRFEESAWNGDQLQNGGEALSYDDMAIRYLYMRKPLPESGRPLYCTDSHIDTFADCNRGDAGRSVVSAATGAYQFNLDSLAARILNTYVAKTKFLEPSGLDPIPVREVSLDAATLVKTLGVDFGKFMSLLKTDTKLIAVRSGHMPLLAPDQEAIEKEEKQYLISEVTRLGGLSQLTKALDSNYDQALVEKFSSLLEDPRYNSGTLPDGGTYSFSSDEKSFMKKQVSLVAPKLKKLFILNEIKALSGDEFNFEPSYGQSPSEKKQKWADFQLSEELAPLLLKRFELYAYEKTNKVESEIAMKDGSKKQVSLPVYLYSQEVRVAAAGLFEFGHQAIDWGFLEKEQATNRAKEETSALGDLELIDLSSISRSTLQWILNNKQVESALNP
jgi:hypothetical protein